MHATVWFRNRVAAAALIATVASACTDATPVESVKQSYVPSAITAVGGNGQTAPVNGTLPQPIVVRVTDATGQPIRGALVRWTAGPASGAVSPQTAVTDAEGLAGTRWTVGATAGPQSLAAALIVGDQPVSTATFAATAVAGAVTTLQPLAGDFQVDTVGALLKDTLTIRALDAQGNPVRNAPVTWVVAAGTGTVVSLAPFTDATGMAKARWVLGRTTGLQLVQVTVGNGAPFTFSAQARSGNPKLLSVESGNNQSLVPIGSTLPQPITVKVVDGFGNAVGGTVATFAATAGGGYFTPATVITDSDGKATARWTMGTRADVVNTGTVTVGGLVADLRAVPSIANSLVLAVVVGGNDQRAKADVVLPEEIVVGVELDDGRRVPGATVVWQAVGGGRVSFTTVRTDENGLARTKWTLGPSGIQSLIATVPGTPAQAVFTAQITP